MAQGRCCLVLVAACATAAAAPATVEIKGARYDQRRDDTASTVVLGRAQLASDGDRTLAEALQRLPGITVDVTGKGAEVRMRGLGNGYTQILLNGVTAPAGFSLDTLAPELVERIEIVRTASAELGSRGIAGTVNIVLRKSVDKAAGEYAIGTERVAGRDAPRASAQWSGKAGTLAWLAGLNATRTVLREPQQQRERMPEGLRTTTFDFLNVADSVTLAPRLVWKPTEADSVTWQGFAGVTRRRITGTGRAQGLPGEFAQQDTVFRSGAPMLRSDLTWLHRTAAGATLELMAGASSSPRVSDYAFLGRTDTDARPTSRQVHADIGDDVLLTKGRYGAAAGGSHTPVAGWDISRDKRSQTRIEQEYGPAGSRNFALDQRYTGHIDRTAVYLQDDWSEGPWSLSAGLRHEALAMTVGTTRQRSRLWSPVLQAAWKMTAAATLRAGLSRTYRPPTMVDLIPRRYTADNNNSATNPDTEGNPGLRPETAWGLDAGVDRYLGGSGLLGASIYARRIDDVILQQLFQDGSRWISRPFNGGRATMHGISVEAKLVVTPALTLRGNVTRNWSRVNSVPGPANRLERQLPVSGTLGVDYRTGAVGLGANFGYQGSAFVRTSMARTSTTGPLRKLDAHATWQIDPQRRLRVEAVNLLHRDSLAAQRYDAGADDWRDTVTATRTHTALRITLEFRQ
jgi:outer membrane receptor protein involved in Fe transport